MTKASISGNVPGKLLTRSLAGMDPVFSSTGHPVAQSYFICELIAGVGPGASRHFRFPFAIGDCKMNVCGRRIACLGQRSEIPEVAQPL